MALHLVRQELEVDLKLPQGRIHPAREPRAQRGVLVHLGLDLRVLPQEGLPPEFPDFPVQRLGCVRRFGSHHLEYLRRGVGAPACLALGGGGDGPGYRGLL